MQRVSNQPTTIHDIEQMEDLLSEPTPGAIEVMKSLSGDLMLLGVGGKMGPTLARMARRASDAAGISRRVIGVSRFSSGPLEGQLRSHGVETIRCDLLDRKQLEALPDVPNVLFMTGMKFGSTGNESLTWAMNSYLPGMVCEKFSRSRIVAFSTGNVYGLSPVVRGGSRESDSFNPVGEYAMSCVGRERMFEHFSRTLRIPMAILRLNYATELRYGVLVDVAQAVWAGQPIDLHMGNFNVIWQADANAMALQAFNHLTTPPRIFNLAGPEILSVRQIAQQFGELLGKPATFRGNEQPEALLSNGQLGHQLMGYPRIGPRQMVGWIADWIRRGGPTHGKPTHFEVRDGTF